MNVALPVVGLALRLSYKLALDSYFGCFSKPSYTWPNQLMSTYDCLSFYNIVLSAFVKQNENRVKK